MHFCLYVFIQSCGCFQDGIRLYRDTGRRIKSAENKRWPVFCKNTHTHTYTHTFVNAFQELDFLFSLLCPNLRCHKTWLDMQYEMSDRQQYSFTKITMNSFLKVLLFNNNCISYRKDQISHLVKSCILLS